MGEIREMAMTQVLYTRKLDTYGNALSYSVVLHFTTGKTYRLYMFYKETYLTLMLNCFKMYFFVRLGLGTSVFAVIELLVTFTLDYDMKKRCDFSLSYK